METINNIITSASTTMGFGAQEENTTSSSSREPVAGEQGRGTKSDPYDHGNEEVNATEGVKANSSQKDFSNQPDTSASTRDGPSEARSGPETGDPNSAQSTSEKYQGAGKPKDEPKDFKKDVPHTDEEREKAMEKGEFPHDPNDHSGEPLQMHGGGKDQDAENIDDINDKKEEGKYDRKNSVAHEGGDPHGEEKKGTGEEYVKSSGVAADGGDFDATNPGAGAEANRLMESKGVHKTAGTSGPPEQADDDIGDAGPGKLSLKDKIKAKLGKNSN